MSKPVHHWRAGALTLISLATALACGSTRATTNYSGVLNIAIPYNDASFSLNVVNGSVYTGPDFFPPDPGGPGWDYDINIYGAEGSFWFSSPASWESPPYPPVTARGYVVSSTDEWGVGPVSNLSLGTLIDGSSLFNRSIGALGDHVNTGTEALFGFRFMNEGADLWDRSDDTVHFGWARVILTPGANPTGVLVDYAWESTPMLGIQAGVVPEPASIALFGGGLAGLLAWSRRRRC